MDKQAQYLVGIDLGTTHTAVAYSRADLAAHEIDIFAIDQLVAPGQVAPRSLLPSVRYHPAEGELSEDDIRFSPAGDKAVVGEAARLLGAKTQGRLVTSAKSWLSHPAVDHGAAILPWGSAEEIDKVSPLDASASYLAHVRNVWRHRFPDAPLEEQDIVITVPASFDEAARSLTLEAARIAGLADVRLLEEPQAVCYDWLRRHAGNIRQALADVHLLLVCDVGGGTTDLTLIKVEPGEKEPKLTRIGVGDHLMLGGDNIDLALARLAEGRLNPGEKKLSTADFSQLIEQCRIAKEQLLADDAPEQVNVTLLGGGSRLIGGSRTTSLTRDEVRNIALDGFFPLSAIDELPDKKRSGVVEFGLPYAAEPAVSKHIAAFLHMHGNAAKEALGKDSIAPDALLLNGGVFRSQPLTQRVIDLLNSWSDKSPKLLENNHPELAVAYGAVSYAVARREKNIRIGGGSARSYFLLIESGKQQQQGVCILPKGSEEGNEIRLSGQQFALRVGQPVRFHLVSHSGDGDYRPGQLVDVDDDYFHSLPPLAVAFEGEDKAEVAVQLVATHTEIGTLQIQCVAIADENRRWDVEFQLRKKGVAASGDVELPPQFEQAAENIQRVFGAKSKQVNPKAVKSLRADLEKALGMGRAEWDTPLLRALFAVLLDGLKNRRRSENHERVWLSLTGFCLRPGFGYPLDDWRVDQLWKTYQQGIQFVNEQQNWSEWWTLWRRIAGGLDTEAQQRLLKDIAKFLNPAAARQAGVAKQIKTRGYEDMVRLAGVLERLPVEKKTELGGWLLKRLQKASEPQQTWWAVGRIGSRVPFHGSSHNVVPATTVSVWLEQLLTVDWKKVPQAGFAATMIARNSGDRARDIDDDMREQVLDKMRSSKLPSSWIAMVEEFTQLDEQQEKQIYGEALPPGLKLIG
ncbi:Hsp70 family protein [Methylomarinum vadi]|uniref:Hsp70 family protein n=1 Tax=Methylomarinum vadi TaxID=438855 RepID=UPI0004DED911|nr:Hsp70 family protein [Methylomarinum vadi]